MRAWNETCTDNLAETMSTSDIEVAGLQSVPACVAGRSAAIHGVNAIVTELGRTNIPVLIAGESGTGKEVYARLIHRLSRNPTSPFIKVNCRVREAEEFLAELRLMFKEGARREGTESGTLFLDGIDELDRQCQKVLLAQLPEEDPENTKGNSIRRIATTTRELDQEVERGTFRAELYFRINGVCLRLPALRARREDVSDFMRHFLVKHAQQQGRNFPELTAGEKEFFETYDWPGNVRELENVARKIVLFGNPRAVIAELRTPIASKGASTEDRSSSLKVVARAASRQAERAMIKEALERTHWNRKQAARDLRVSYKSLLYKIKETGLDGKQLDQE